MPTAIHGKHPTCYVIAGPNGAGKTTFAMEFLPRMAGCQNFINADLIARSLSPLNVDAAAMEARRLFLRQIQVHCSKKSDSAFETTLFGTAHVRLLRTMQSSGYSVRFYYLWIPSVALTLRRIAERVRRGGHDIPTAVARRRYRKSLKNFFALYMPMADYCAVFDNSSAAPRLVYERDGVAERIVNSLTHERIRRQAGGAT